MKKLTKVLSIDVESIGLHGEGYAVGGCLLNVETGERTEKFTLACDPSLAEGSDEDRKWVAKNIPHLPANCESPFEVREIFWKMWLKMKEDYPDLVMAAECGWPVEARFLTDCADDWMDGERDGEGPYPLHEISSFLIAAGMDPMATYPREEGESPKHDPLADAMQSARLLYTALGLLDPRKGEEDEV